MQALSKIPSKTVTSGYRSIKDGSRYNPYFPPPDERDRVIINDGEVTDTVELMEKVVWKYLDDTKRIAPLLRRSSNLETCKAIWEFMYAISNTNWINVDWSNYADLLDPGLNVLQALIVTA